MIKVKTFPLSNARRDANGMLTMPNGSNFYQDWYQLMSAHKIPYLTKSAKSNLDDMLRCAVWFMTLYKSAKTSIEDLQRYTDMYELSLIQFLAKERILVERGRKHCEIFPNLLSVTAEISCLLTITKKVLGLNSIDWITVDTDAVCVKA